MEEKILKAKELKDLLSKLARLKGQMSVIPFDNHTIVGVFLGHGDLRTLFHQESFHSYEEDPSKCNLSVLRGFFSLPEIEDRLAKL